MININNCNNFSNLFIILNLLYIFAIILKKLKSKQIFIFAKLFYTFDI